MQVFQHRALGDQVCSLLLWHYSVLQLKRFRVKTKEPRSGQAAVNPWQLESEPRSDSHLVYSLYTLAHRDPQAKTLRTPRDGAATLGKLGGHQWGEEEQKEALHQREHGRAKARTDILTGALLPSSGVQRTERRLHD